MPLSRKPLDAKVPPLPVPAPKPAATLKASRWLPRRLVALVLLRDESGSMQQWRQRQGEFNTQMRASLTDAGGAKVADLIYTMDVVVSGGVVSSDFRPLSEAIDPAYEPDGQTPLGKALTVVAEKLEKFLTHEVFPAETTVKALEVVVVSDLKPTGETAEETEAGVARFIDTAKKYRANMTLIGPAPEAMNGELAARLDIGEKGVRYLDSDPKSVLNITFDSLVSASRALTGTPLSPPSR